MTVNKETKPSKQVAFKIIEGAANIDTLIKSLANRGKKFERELHQCAVACLNHAEKCGDITLAQRLVEAVPAGMRKKALNQWFVTMGKFKWNEETKKLAWDKSKVTMLQEAIKTPFWELVPEKDVAPFDLTKAIDALLARAKKAQERGDTVDTAKLEAIAKIAQEAK